MRKNLQVVVLAVYCFVSTSQAQFLRLYIRKETKHAHSDIFCQKPPPASHREVPTLIKPPPQTEEVPIKTILGTTFVLHYSALSKSWLLK